MRKICDALGRVKHKWHKIGIQIGIPHHKLEEIEQESNDKLAAVIDFWLEGNVEEKDCPLCWMTIVKALLSSHVDESALAKEVHRTYCEQEDSSVESEYTLRWAKPNCRVCVAHL